MKLIVALLSSKQSTYVPTIATDRFWGSIVDGLFRNNKK
jgi:hypothetical protein